MATSIDTPGITMVTGINMSAWGHEPLIAIDDRMPQPPHGPCPVRSTPREILEAPVVANLRWQ